MGDAEQLCARSGITDLTDFGTASFDGAPWELLDRGADACDGHPWFSQVWPCGSGRLAEEFAWLEPDNCADEICIFGKPPKKNQVDKSTTAGHIRRLSDFRFYEMVQQLSEKAANRCR